MTDKWEYICLTAPCPDERNALIEYLNQVGLEGWELCTLHPATAVETKRSCSIAVFKRRLPDD